MLTELKLSNFRLFDDEVTVRFRPITIFIGENNAGKSSIIKFLMLLKQSIGVLGGGFFTMDGESIELGEFSYLKNKNTTKRDLTFSLGVNDNVSPADQFFDFVGRKKIDYKEGSYVTQATVNYTGKSRFLGKNQQIIYMAGNQKWVESSLISPNSVFLDFQTGMKNSNSMPDVVRHACVERLHYDIQGLRHLSAIREELKGEIATSSKSLGYVGKKGEQTISAMLHSGILEDKERKDFLLGYTRRVLDVDNIHFTRLRRLVACDAKNVRTEATTSIAEFGFGVSQCLPVFTQGLLMPQYTQLIVEQPEAQVHPTAQIEMGSFFADLWGKYQVGSIIETHSSNILLGIQRRIEEERRKKKKSERKVSMDNISIAFFTDENGVVVVKNLDMDEGGNISGLPMEFWGGDLIELLKIGALSDE